MSEAVITRLPKDTLIQTTSHNENGVKVAISMTLETVDQAEALALAVKLAIIPLLEINSENHKRIIVASVDGL